MSFPIAVIIMLIAGITGGIVNYLLPSNTDGQSKKIRTWIQCVFLGIGATLLVPLFLEIAQSKLLDKIHLGYEWQVGEKKNGPKKSNSTGDAKEAPIPLPKNIDSSTAKTTDSNGAAASNNTSKKDSAGKNTTVFSSDTNDEAISPPLKDYLLWTAYCFLAAAAGVRFINNIMDSVLKDRQIANLKDQNAEEKKAKEDAEAQKAAAEKLKAAAEAQRIAAEKEKEEAEKIKLKWAMNNRNEAEKQEAISLEQVQLNIVREPATNVLPAIGPVTNLDDPQKGRFGGKALSNDRQLKAEVKKSLIPNFYNVKIWVESTNPAKPLTDEVIFYIHDSFRPSVYPITPKEFKEGKAMDDEIQAYGAFTVGAVADKGATLLELDLADQPEFPKEFRER